MKMFGYPCAVLASLAVLACSGCANDPIARAIGLGGNGCHCSPDRIAVPPTPAVPARPSRPETPKRPCPGPGPCPLGDATK